MTGPDVRDVLLWARSKAPAAVLLSDAAIELLVGTWQNDHDTPQLAGFEVETVVDGAGRFITDILVPEPCDEDPAPTARDRRQRDVSPAKTRRTSADTSRDASRSNLVRRGNQRWRILEELAQGQERHPLNDLTAEQLHRILGLPLNSVSTRCSELTQAGLLADEGTRRTSTGSQATKYRITALGREALTNSRREVACPIASTSRIASTASDSVR